MPSYQQWTFFAALPALISQTLAMLYGLYILAYPPRYRTLAFLTLCVPTVYAFKHHLELTPWYSLNDTMGRMLYIWLAYMSYAVQIVRVRTEVGSGGWRRRLKAAWKVLYTRHLGEYHVPAEVRWVGEKEGIVDGDRVCGERQRELRMQSAGALSAAPSAPGSPVPSPTPPNRRREPPHNLTTLQFTLHHIKKAALFLALNHLYDNYLTPPSALTPPSFIRRLPTSLTPAELKLRAMLTWDVCIADMLYFDAVYSIFALLWVAVFRFDCASEWSLSLFGSLRSARSVRLYWGAYWHDFINASFTAHVKGITRGWLRMRGACVRRLVENGAVFVVSGLMHTLVRYVQTGGRGEIWTVALWYAAQMLPIVVEGVVQRVWSRSGLRRRSQVMFGDSVLKGMEAAVEYAWVFCWMFWSVPKYLLTRQVWELENFAKRHPEVFAGRMEQVKLDLGEL